MTDSSGQFSRAATTLLFALSKSGIVSDVHKYDFITSNTDTIASKLIDTADIVVAASKARKESDAARRESDATAVDDIELNETISGNIMSNLVEYEDEEIDFSLLIPRSRKMSWSDDLPSSPSTTSATAVTDASTHNRSTATSSASKSKGEKSVKTTSKEAFSPSTLISSLRRLEAHSAALKTLSSFITLVVSWEKPALTLSIGLIYLLICYKPQLMFGLPLWIFVFGFMTPGYFEKHLSWKDIDYDFRKNAYRKDFFNGDISNDGDVSKLLHQEYKTLSEKRQKKAIFDIVSDLQHGLYLAAHSLDKLQLTLSNLVNFQNEKLSTSLTTILLLVSIPIVYVASFITMRSVMLSVGFNVFVGTHPQLRKSALQYAEKYLEMDPIELEHLIKQIQLIEEETIIIDEPPVEKFVEVFELSRRGLTPRQWDHASLFSLAVYEQQSYWRKECILPPFATSQSEILPPDGWYFEAYYDWEVDTHPSSWISDRGLLDLVVEDNGWVVDVSGEWRRRRWVRKAFRTY